MQLNTFHFLCVYQPTYVIEVTLFWLVIVIQVKLYIFHFISVANLITIDEVLVDNSLLTVC